MKNNKIKKYFLAFSALRYPAIENFDPKRIFNMYTKNVYFVGNMMEAYFRFALLHEKSLTGS